MIGIAISFLLIISIINPLQVEAEAIIESSVYISSIKENYTYDNTNLKLLNLKVDIKVGNIIKVK
ncbi:hypothetical protein ITJ07_0009895 [Clostridioides difficile]|uniref:hypothetical protein n=1 Tax=Clostridioides difficile TaxID=1496 RepID=UPI0023E37579|nr:hypothetical protein [Clostridioides difficile]MDQ7920555.1 hypothetical protein [Clostridioides difficile]